MTSREMREDPFFMRNSFTQDGKWGIPLVRSQEIDLSNIKLIACSDTKTNDNLFNMEKGVHFFVDVWRFEGIYNNPEKSLKRYSQYKFLLTPDFSTYAEMAPWRQMESVAKNRWVGAYWQSKGLIVVPTMSWGLTQSFDFCFDGAEKGGVVAIGMIGCKKNRLGYMRGYEKMLETIEPSGIICLGDPFPEMQGNLIVVDYRDSREVMR